jgi:hypothetical protein
MALTAIIISTFIFPIVILAMLLSWKEGARKEVERQKRSQAHFNQYPSAYYRFKKQTHQSS